FRQIDREARRGWKALGGFFLGGGRKVGFAGKRFGVACEREAETAPAVGPLRVVVERPGVTRAVVMQRRWTELARDERRDERAARLVHASNQPHGQPLASTFAVHIHTERTDRPTASARLLGAEEAEEDAAAGRRLGDGERAAGAELVVE